MRRLLILFLLLHAPTLFAQDAAYKPVAQVRADFLKLLDRPKVAADAKIVGTTQTPGNDWTLEQLDFASEKKADGTLERVPTLIYRPTKTAERLPAVIVLHGTGGSAEGMVPFLKELQTHGIIGVAIDARYHGRRAGGAKGAIAYNEAIVRAWKTSGEHPFYYDTVWDLWRLVDYLETRPEIEAKRLGMIGFSMGGIQTWLAASVDRRVLVSVPTISVQSFKWSLENDRWQGRANTIKVAHQSAAKDLGEPAVNGRVCKELWNKVIPGILDEFDCPSMLRLFADRPLLIASGTMDPNCPVEGAKIAVAAAEKAYREAGASDKLRVMFAEVAHTVTAEQRQAALEWFVRWLKK